MAQGWKSREETSIIRKSKAFLTVCPDNKNWTQMTYAQTVAIALVSHGCTAFYNLFFCRDCFLHLPKRVQCSI